MLEIIPSVYYTIGLSYYIIKLSPYAKEIINKYYNKPKLHVVMKCDHEFCCIEIIVTNISNKPIENIIVYCANPITKDFFIPFLIYYNDKKPESYSDPFRLRPGESKHIIYNPNSGYKKEWDYDKITWEFIIRSIKNGSLFYAAFDEGRIPASNQFEFDKLFLRKKDKIIINN